MLPIMLVSVTPYAGKNVITLGLAHRLRQVNKKVGYFKPIGPLATYEDGVLTDEDAVFFKRQFGLDEPLASLCPIVLSDETIASLMRGAVKNVKERMLSAFEEVSRDKDFVLAVNMGRLSSGLALGYPSHEFIRDIGAKVIIVDRYRWPVETLDGIFHMKNLLPDHVVGVVFNRIPSAKVSHIEQAVCPFLESRGVDVLGIMPDDPVLGAVPVPELVEALNAKVLCCGDHLDVLAEHFSIGAMNAEAALRFFQRVPNKAVITGGDRSDIQLAALQTSTRCLVLTGDIYPNERILARAEEVCVPVILSPLDTLATVDICDRLHGHLSLQSESKLSRVREMFDACINWDALSGILGIGK